MQLDVSDFKELVRRGILLAIDLVIKNEKGEVLVGLRKNAPAKDFWFVPGGRVYKNEKMIAALARIIRQEVGFEVGHKVTSEVGSENGKPKEAGAENRNPKEISSKQTSSKETERKEVSPEELDFKKVDLKNVRLLGVYDHIYPDNFFEDPAFNTHYVVTACELIVSFQNLEGMKEQHHDCKFISVADLLADPKVHPFTKSYFSPAENLFL